METITLNFDNDLPLKKWAEMDDKPGIYIHYIKDEDENKNRIVYVGKANSIKDRNKDHNTNYEKKKYLVFTIEEDGLYFQYIPDYDPRNKEIKPMPQIFVVGATSDCNNLNEIEGAISIHLFRSAKNRKYLTTYKLDYGLRDTKLVFTLPDDLILEGLPDFIETPKS